MDPATFLDNCFPTFYKEVEDLIDKYKALKINVELACDFIIQKKDKEVQATIYLVTEMTEMHMSDCINLWYRLNVKDVLIAKFDKFQEGSSGKALAHIKHLVVNVCQFDPLNTGSRYVRVPKSIVKKGALININNDDDYCFLWCVAAALFPVKNNHKNECRSYQVAFDALKTSLKVTDDMFPMDIASIPKFEADNPELSFTVFGLEGDVVVGPLHVAKERKKHHIQLLYVSDENNDHYCLITSLSRLAGSQLSKHQHKKHICERCLQYFASESKLESHLRDCSSKPAVKLNLPKPEDAKLKFTNVHKQDPVPFVVYADIETLTTPMQRCEPDPARSYTDRIQKHEPFAVAFNVVCTYDPSLSYFKSCRRTDCIPWLLQELESLAQEVRSLIEHPKPMVMTDDDVYRHESCNTCHICKQEITSSQNKVCDHNHFTGAYRGPAHESCNVNFRVVKFIPIFFHNLSGFDSHFIIRELAHQKYDRYNIIAQNHERFISFSLWVDDMRLQFLDSYKFMASSLDALVKGLPSQELKHTRHHFPQESHFNLCVRKGVFPYDYVNNWRVLEDQQLPSKDAFYSILNDASVTDSDYEHACKVWREFGIQTLGEYADLYLKIDTLLLTDVFEKFRSVCLSIYGLDPCHYYTSPGLSWDAMLKMTGIELDLLTDVDMLLLFERGIRGGFVSLVQRHATANNRYMMEGYDPSKPTSYLMYYDVNNLYGMSMSKPLPYGNFRWLSDREVANFVVEKAAQEVDRGYVLEVDLTYPQKEHDKHSDLPFCVEHRVPPHSQSNQPKLVATLNNKERYVIHIDHLRLCKQYGLEITKIHRIVSFNQRAWLKPYMDLNTQHRQKATTDFETNFFKLMNNCIYGKSMENVRKHRDIRLVKQWEGRYGARKFVAKPNFKAVKIIADDLVTIELSKVELTYTKPIYLGMVILDHSKVKMYEFHYGFARQHFGDVSLLYMDTDSFIYHIRDIDAYKVMRQHSVQFDTSSYDPNNEFGIVPQNKKVMGLMKDECASEIMTEFVGLASKMYAYSTIRKRSVTKAKGVRHNLVRRFSIDDYRNALSGEDYEPLCKQRRLASSSHQVFAVVQNKLSLRAYDDKRMWDENGMTSRPWGYTST